MKNIKSTLTKLAGASLVAMAATGAFAQEVTLKMHQLLPRQAVVPSQVLDVWAEKVMEESGGRIQIDHFPAMQLGGIPPELMDQAVDGVADIIWTVVGYTPGRFPVTEVFELPFMVDDARAASCAYWKMYEEHMVEDFAGVKMLAGWVHGPGLFHTADPVEAPGDLEGMKIRGGSRLVNQLLEATGATPVGMPVPAVAEGLSKGVIDGTTIPWEVTRALKTSEIVENHTEFEGPGLYTLTFAFAMNEDSYNAMPADLQAIIDANSGQELSVFAGGVQSDADAPGRAAAEDLGNEIYTVSAAEAAADWAPIVNPIYDTWIADMDAKGYDGQALIDQAKGLMAGECAGATSSNY